jgi:hypothetical protein
MCSYLNIEQNDISGCIQYYQNPLSGAPNYALVLYDRTPGGAGHVRRLQETGVLEAVLLIISHEKNGDSILNQSSVDFFL